MLKSESWLTVPPPKEKVFVRCPGRDSIFGRESFLRVTILPTSGKLPISMPPHAHAHAFPFSYANPNSQNDAFKFHLRLVSSSHTISEKVTDQLIFKQQGISLCKLLEKLFWRTCLLSMLKIIRQLSVNIMASVQLQNFLQYISHSLVLPLSFIITVPFLNKRVFLSCDCRDSLA